MCASVICQFFIHCKYVMCGSMYVICIPITKQPVYRHLKIILYNRAFECLMKPFPHCLISAVFLSYHLFDFPGSILQIWNNRQISVRSANINNIRLKCQKFLTGKHSFFIVLVVFRLKKIRMDAIIQKKKLKRIYNVLCGLSTQNSNTLLHPLITGILKKSSSQLLSFRHYLFCIKRILQFLHPDSFLHLFCKIYPFPVHFKVQYSIPSLRRNTA